MRNGAGIGNAFFEKDYIVLSIDFQRMSASDFDNETAFVQGLNVRLVLEKSQTRNNERMDLVIYYRGEQSIIEMKIWHGNSYNKRGEEQLLEYLDYFNLQKGYMLSFNFNKKKEIGVKEVAVGNKLLIEAVV